MTNLLAQRDAHVRALIKAAAEDLDDASGVVHVCVWCGDESPTHEARRAHRQVHLEASRHLPLGRPRQWNNEIGEWI